jgi:5-methylcytosine-specific restriction endonuclease McrA
MGKPHPPSFPLWLVLRIAERDRWTCQICHEGYRPGDPWEIHHNIAWAKGGTNHIKNLVLAHRSCNRELGAA